MEHKEIIDLASLLRRDGDRLLDASSKLSLSSSILGKLNQTLSTIKPSDAILNDFIDLGFLYDFVQQTLALKLFPDQHILNTILDISLFSKLKLLEVHRLSLNLITGLKNFRSQLEYVTCMRSVSELGDVLERCGGDKSEGYVWRELKSAVFSHNQITNIDCSLEFTPNLQSLDLSYNNIKNAEAVNCLPDLKYLNLANNQIDVLPAFKGTLSSNLQILNLRNNFIESFKELSSLINLKELDLSNNCLVDFYNLLPLMALSKLHYLRLSNNPITHHSNYRVKTCTYLNESILVSSFLLDNQSLSKKELRLVGSAEIPQEFYLQRCESFNSTTTASTVVQLDKFLKRVEISVNQTSDMEISSGSVEVGLGTIISPTSTIRNCSFHDQGMQDSGFEAGPRPISPSSSIDPVTSKQEPNASIENPIPICSASSLQNADDEPENAIKYSESDIEVLSNPSQSSIEVLSNNTQAPRCVRSCVILPHVLKELCVDADLSKLSEELRRSL